MYDTVAASTSRPGHAASRRSLRIIPVRHHHSYRAVAAHGYPKTDSPHLTGAAPSQRRFPALRRRSRRPAKRRGVDQLQCGGPLGRGPPRRDAGCLPPEPRAGSPGLRSRTRPVAAGAARHRSRRLRTGSAIRPSTDAVYRTLHDPDRARPLRTVPCPVTVLGWPPVSGVLR